MLSDNPLPVLLAGLLLWPLDVWQRSVPHLTAVVS